MRARVADLNAAVAKAARAVEVQKEETEDLSDQLEVARKLAQTLRSDCPCFSPLCDGREERVEWRKKKKRGGG